MHAGTQARRHAGIEIGGFVGRGMGFGWLGMGVV